ncbi:hypothetical protein LCM20_18405 [Halobacillus litoralis]|nr:hypothetical protein [Halobacillus litoralis]MCA0972574.1 hypothetical protein [Halobacillus litoralis]
MVAWMHAFFSMRILFIGFFSLTALSLLTFQSVAIFQAVMEMFEVFIHRK